MACGLSTFALILVFGGNCFLALGGCPAKYSSLPSWHTLCLTDKGQAMTLSPQQKQAIVDRHNEIRGQVYPSATNMQKLVWDDDLAEAAGKWAGQCKFGRHDRPDLRELPGMPGVYIGQNMAWSTASDPMEAIKEWQKEIDNFKYGTNSGKVFGRYSQLIWDETGRVGCGMADCSQFLANYPTFFICNYAVGGNTNWAGRGWIPYTQGDSCGACPGKCDSTGKLCDCGGLVCNGGTVDVSTCSCK